MNKHKVYNIFISTFKVYFKLLHSVMLLCLDSQFSVGLWTPPTEPLDRIWRW